MSYILASEISQSERVMYSTKLFEHYKDRSTVRDECAGDKILDMVWTMKRLCMILSW